MAETTTTPTGANAPKPSPKPKRRPSAVGGIVTIPFDLRDPNRLDWSATK